MTDSCDVVVIGGGPGGSACATLLADQGYTVVLLERATFPREHVGESLLPASIPVLEQIGVMPEIEAAGFVTKRGATLVWGKNPDPWSWYFADDPGQRPTSFQVVRSEFDHILLKNAAKRGVDVRENHQVLDVEFEGGRPTGIRFLHDGSEARIDARFVVDASGQAAILSRKLKLHQWDDYFQNLAVYGYYRDARHLDPPNDGNIFIESYEHGWLWKIPLHTGVTSVGAVVDKQVGQQGLREHGADGFLEAQIALAPHTRELLADAQRVGTANVERDWSYTSRQFAGDGYVLVGDAACFVDPLFSSGVHLALGSATLAATYVKSALSNPATRAEAAQLYESLYRKQYDYFHLTAQLFYGTNRSADSYFWEARRILGEDDTTPREAFVRVVSGQPPHGYERAVIEHGELPPEIESGGPPPRSAGGAPAAGDGSDHGGGRRAAPGRALAPCARQAGAAPRPGRRQLPAGVSTRGQCGPETLGTLSDHSRHGGLHRPDERPVLARRDHQRRQSAAQSPRRAGIGANHRA